MKEWINNKGKQEILEEPITTGNCGDKVRIVKEITGFSNNTLSIRLGIKESHINKIEDDEVTPTKDVMDKIQSICDNICISINLKHRLEEEITKENCGEKLKLVRQISKISRREMASIIGISEATIRRIESRESIPTDEMINLIHAVCVIGISKFNKLSQSEREKVSEVLGTVGGTVAGVGGAIGAVSVSGSVAGLSAAGMTSGLAALGGASMVAGIGVVASIPIATGLAGWGLVKGIKKICKQNKLVCEEIDDKWEIKKNNQGDAND